MSSVVRLVSKSVGGSWPLPTPLFISTGSTLRSSRQDAGRHAESRGATCGCRRSCCCTLQFCLSKEVPSPQRAFYAPRQHAGELAAPVRYPGVFRQKCSGDLPSAGCKRHRNNLIMNLDMKTYELIPAQRIDSNDTEHVCTRSISFDLSGFGRGIRRSFLMLTRGRCKQMSAPNRGTK